MNSFESKKEHDGEVISDRGKLGKNNYVAPSYLASREKERKRHHGFGDTLRREFMPKFGVLTSLFIFFLLISIALRE